MVGLALILGIAIGGVAGYLLGYRTGFTKGKAYMIKRKRWYDKTRK